MSLKLIFVFMLPFLKEICCHETAHHLTIPSLRTSALCRPQARLQFCNPKKTDEPGYHWYRPSTNRVVAVIRSGYENSSLHAIWGLVDGNDGVESALVDYENKSIVTFEPFTLDHGEHELNLYLTERPKGGGKEGQFLAQCFLTVVPSPPIAVIKGGSARTVSKKRDLTVSGEDSVNVDCAAQSEDCFLFYEWSCAGMDFCDDFVSNENKIHLAKEKLEDGNLTVVLKVKSRAESEWVTANQTVSVVELEIPSVEIICDKNCPPSTLAFNPRICTHFRLSSGFDLSDATFNWYLCYSAENCNEKATGLSLLLPENSVLEGASFHVEVRTEGWNLTLAKYDVVQHEFNGGCKVDPNSGTVLTEFEVTCDCGNEEVKGPLVYQVFQEGVLLKSSVEKTFVVFFSGATEGSALPLTAAVHNTRTGVSYKCPRNFSVQVTVFDKPLEDALKLYRGGLNSTQSITELLKYNEVDKAIQMMNIIASSLDKAEGGQEFKRNFTILLLQDLMKFPLVGPFEIEQISCVMDRLLAVGAEESSDPTISKLASVTMRYMAHVLEEKVGKEQFAVSLQAQVAKIAGTMMEASEKVLIPNEPLMEIPSKWNITTPVPPISEIVPQESYPDYELPDDEYTEKLRNFEEASASVLETLRSLGRAIARSLKPGEAIHIFETRKGATLVVKRQSKKLAGLKLESPDGTVSCIVSADFKTMKDTVAVVSSFYNGTGPFWWYRRSNVHTQILDAAFYVGASFVRKNTYKNPLKIFFTRTKTVQIAYESQTVSVASNVDAWTSEAMDEMINVHRVTVKPGQGLLVSFADLNNAVIDLVVTQRRRPRYEDFRDAIVMSGNSSSYYLPSDDYSTESYVYLGVLPNKVMLTARSPSVRSAVFRLDYKVGVELPQCLSWIPPGREWEEGTHCRAGKSGSSNYLQCDCYKGSIFAGIYRPGFGKLERVRSISKVVTLQANRVIFFTVLFLFLAFCCASLSQIDKRNRTEDVYFLTDNLSSHRFAYLLIVRTGKQISAGTTSNIMIKIKGRKRETAEHVLNLPDPERQILRRGREDRFVLATERHLGEIAAVELRFDCVGTSPSWFCENIEIYDLQLERCWFFEVKRWFDVIKDANVEAIVVPSRTMKRRHPKRWEKVTRFLRRITSRHCWNLKSEKDMSSLKRLSLILSTITSGLMISICLFGMPKLQISDSFSRFGHFDVYVDIFVNAVATSLGCFCLNLPVMYLFRNSQEQFEKEKSDAKRFTFKGTITAWIWCCGVTVLSVTFLIVCGFWSSETTSLLCIASVLLALIFDVLVLEYVYFLVFKGEIFCNEKINNVDKAAVIEKAELQRATLFATLGNRMLRPFIVHLYEPLKEEYFKECKQKQLARINFRSLLQDALMFGVYLALLYHVVLANKDSYNILSNREVRSMLIGGAHRHTVGLSDVRNTKTLLLYVNETVIPALQAVQWYHTYFVHDPGQTIDYNNKILGVARLRQHRMARNTCPFVSFARSRNMSCVAEFSPYGYLTGAFEDFWRKKMAQVEYNRLIDFWKFKRDGQIVTGRFESYPRGGYSAVLGRNVYNSYFNLDYIANKDWLNIGTRMICVEFLIYNVNYNVFNSAKLVLEKTAGGYFDESYTVKTSRLLFVKSQLQYVTIFFILAFHLVLLTIVSRKTFKLIENFKQYFNDFWNVTDIFIILSSFACITLFAYRTELVRQFLIRVKYAKKNEFINYDSLFHVEDALNVIASILVCVTTIRMWKLLRFGQMFLKLEGIIACSAKPLAALFLCQMILISASAVCGYLLFGAHSSYFKGTWLSICSLFYISLNLYKRFDYNVLTETQGRLGSFYYATFMFATFTVYTLYVTAVIMGCSLSENYFSNKQTAYSVQDFLKEETWYYANLIGVKMKHERLRAGKEESDSPKVFPKDDSERYGKFIETTRPRMEAMRSIVKATFVNRRVCNYNRPDYLLMEEVVRKLASINGDGGSSEKFLIANSGRKVQLIDDAKILLMEIIVAELLGAKFPAAHVCIERFNSISEAFNVVIDIIKNIRIVCK